MRQIDRNTGYISRLNQIGKSFGFVEKEIADISASVYADYLRRKHPDGSHKMILCKLMVRKCIFMISARICSESPNSIFSEKQYFGYNNYSGVPFTCLIVYLLSYVIGFDENEVVELLNISSGQVRERLARASNILKNRKRA